MSTPCCAGQRQHGGDGRSEPGPGARIPVDHARPSLKRPSFTRCFIRQRSCAAIPLFRASSRAGSTAGRCSAGRDPADGRDCRGGPTQSDRIPVRRFTDGDAPRRSLHTMRQPCTTGVAHAGCIADVLMPALLQGSDDGPYSAAPNRTDLEPYLQLSHCGRLSFSWHRCVPQDPWH